jgi:hypothetical protein
MASVALIFAHLIMHQYVLLSLSAARRRFLDVGDVFGRRRDVRRVAGVAGRPRLRGPWRGALSKPPGVL